MTTDDRANSENWISYFGHNRDHLMTINWDDNYRLTPAEVQTITRSLQQFQLGESSEGRHILAQARRYAERSGDTEFVPALELFIKEEQRHSGDLARFMQQQGLPLTNAHWVDTVFRGLRAAFNLELSVMAMLTAEIIAVPYYKALHDATKSPLLRDICRQLLRDEMQHLNFQMDILGKLRRNRSALGMAAALLVQRTLFCGAVLVVWQQHRQVFHAGGFSFGKFWKVAWQRFNRTMASGLPAKALRSI
jgi:hypothetical protein